MDTPETTSSSDSPANDPARNSIRPGKRRQRQAPDPGQPGTAAQGPSNAAAPSRAVPEAIAKRFIQVRNKYYFPDGARAFTDRGNRLTTPSENTEVVRSLIGIARARGWHDITVRGTERFRQEAWVQASLAGLHVSGYRPTEVEQGRLVRSLAQERGVDAPTPGVDADSIARSNVGEGSPAKPRSGHRDFLLTGQLIEHGRAPYKQDPKAAMSYFVKLKTARGEQVVWGVDLERAFKESLTKPEKGDEVALRRLSQEKVKIPARDDDGRVTGGTQVERVRNRWVLEKREFFEARAAAARSVQDPQVPAKQAVQRHPELVGTYMAVHAAELVAKRMKSPEDAARFLAIVRAALANSVARGEPLPAVNLRDRAKARTPDPREREPESARG